MTRSEAHSRLAAWLEHRGLYRREWRQRMVSVPVSWPRFLWCSGPGLVTLWLACQVPTGLILVAGGEPLAGLVARLHRTGGELALAALVLHLLRAAWVGAWRPPRELVWLSGGLALALVVGLERAGDRLAALWPGEAAAGPLAWHLALSLAAAVVWALHLASSALCPAPARDSAPRQLWWPAGCLAWAVVALGGLMLWLALAAYAPDGAGARWWLWPWRGLVALVEPVWAWLVVGLAALALALLPWWGRLGLPLVRVVVGLALGLGVGLGLWWRWW